MSSETDFQNGFICGMATKGLIKGGLYQPIVWNDEGIYSYFYINFKRAIQPFSTGMLAESIIVYDSEQIPITGVIKISPGIYKVYADISGKTKGITVVHKKSTYLYFISGTKVNPFSVFFFVAGLDSYQRLAYAYDSSALIQIPFTIFEEFNMEFWDQHDTDVGLDTVSFDYEIPISDVYESVIISFWAV